jgi:hypothetical protein
MRDYGIDRHEGKVHDRVTVKDEEGGYFGDVTVLAGEDESGTVAVMSHSQFLHASYSLTPEEAIRLGRILVAAGEDTLSRPRAQKDAGTDEKVSP